MALSDRDVVGIAETGSGKTLTYYLPAIVHINAQPSDLVTDIVLILAPTHELAVQIQQDISKFWQATRTLLQMVSCILVLRIATSRPRLAHRCLLMAMSRRSLRRWLSICQSYLYLGVVEAWRKRREDVIWIVYSIASSELAKPHFYLELHGNETYHILLMIPCIP